MKRFLILLLFLVTACVQAFAQTTATPVFSVSAGTYLGTQTVAVTDSTTFTGTVTTSGNIATYASGPSFTSFVVGSPITINGSHDVVTGIPSSTTLQLAYGIGTNTTPVTYTAGATIYCTSGSTGSTPTTSSPVYFTYFNIASTTTVECIAAASGYANSAIASATYTISPATATVTLNDSSVTNLNATRYGINLAALNNYDAPSYKDLVRLVNFNFQPLQFSQLWALDNAGTTTTFQSNDCYFTEPANAWSGAVVTVPETQGSGGNKGYSGTVTANTTGTGSCPSGAAIYTISPALSGASAQGDIFEMVQMQSPTNFNASGAPISGSLSNGAVWATDTATQYTGQDSYAGHASQSLVCNASAANNASCSLQMYFGDNTNNFAVMTGTWQLSMWARTYSGSPMNLQDYVHSGCSGSLTGTSTGTWTQYTGTLTCTQTNTSIGNNWIQINLTNTTGNTGQVEIALPSIIKTSPVDSTNTTVFRDEYVDTLKQLMGNGVAGAPCTFRPMLNIESGSFANWVANPGAAYNVSGGAGWNNSFGTQQPRLQEYLALIKLIGCQPYLQLPLMWTTTDITNFVEYMSSTDTSNPWEQLRAGRDSQTAPWVGTGGVFSHVYASICNECWNYPNNPGLNLPDRGSAPSGGSEYYDAANLIRHLIAAGRGDAAYSSNMMFGFNVQTGTTYNLNNALTLMGAVGGAPDYLEFNGYQQFYLSSWNTPANQWQSTILEAYADSYPANAPISGIPQTWQTIVGLHLCGASGTSQCLASIYEEANSTQGTCGQNGQQTCNSVANAAMNQLQLQQINDGALQGVIVSLQAANNEQGMTLLAQNFFGLSGYENGSDIGGSIYQGTLVAGGTNYNVGDYLYPSGGGSNSFFLVTSTASNPGPVTGIQLVSGGYGYGGVTAGATTTSATGSGATITTLTESLYSRLWGATEDIGGSMSYLDGTFNRLAPSGIGIMELNQSIVGPEFSSSVTANLPTYQWPGSNYNGSTYALANVPWIQVHAYCEMNSGGTACLSTSGAKRSVVFWDTDVNRSYTVGLAGSNLPSGTCTIRQYAPSNPSTLNSATIPAATNTYALQIPVPTPITEACPSTLTLPAGSITAIDYTIGGTPQASTPTFSPAAGTYTSSQSVVISDSTPSSTIYYTTDGTTPTTASAQYLTPISITSTKTVKAIATAPGYSQSAVGSALYTINPPAATPVFTPAPGSYAGTQSVAVTDSTPSPTIYCTTDGTTPTTSSPVYSAPFSVPATQTILCIATAAGYSQSAVGGGTYTITTAPVAATPVLSLSTGTYLGTQSMTVTDATAGATIYYTTDGTTPTTSSSIYVGAILITATTTFKAIAAKAGYTNSAVASSVITIVHGFSFTFNGVGGGTVSIGP